jgi:ubiquinone/menaquinone biosynthesis C-methylase UbiE
VLFDVLEHIEDISGALSEVRRISKKGAHILISLPNLTGSYSLVNDILKERIGLKLFPLKGLIRYQYLRHHHVHLYHFSWWTKLLKKNALSPVKCHNIEVFTPLITTIIGHKRSAALSLYDAENADRLPTCMASEWFIYAINEKNE